MKYKNYQQRLAVLESYKKKWLAQNPKLTDNSGIYVLLRVDENGITYSYVGQAKHLLSRLAEHLQGYQHIDNSLRNHGLYSQETPCGWKAYAFEYPESELNDKERYYIEYCLKQGYQSRNKTLGGQDKGKVGLGDGKTPKGYYDGKKQGYEDCRKYVALMVKKYVSVSPKQLNKVGERKFKEFEDFLLGL